MSPSARSTKALKAAGYFVANVEKFVRFPPPGHRVDAFGCLDLIAIRGDETIGIQTTSGSNVAARIAKIRLIPAADHWMASATRKLLIHGWAKRGERGKAKRWTCRCVQLTQTGEVEL